MLLLALALLGSIMLQLLKLVELALAFSVTIKLELATDSFLLLGFLEKLAALTARFKLLS
jgi:hypothetical protein